MANTSTNSNANLAPDGTQSPPAATTGGTRHEAAGTQRTPEEDSVREHAIREAAYRRAEARGDAPGDEKQDWLDAQAEVDGRSA
jgi:hypothetical protein